MKAYASATELLTDPPPLLLIGCPHRIHTTLRATDPTGFIAGGVHEISRMLHGVSLRLGCSPQAVGTLELQQHCRAIWNTAHRGCILYAHETSENNTPSRLLNCTWMVEEEDERFHRPWKPCQRAGVACAAERGTRKILSWIAGDIEIPHSSFFTSTAPPCSESRVERTEHGRTPTKRVGEHALLCSLNLRACWTIPTRLGDCSRASAERKATFKTIN